MFSIYVETICIDMHEDEKGSDVLKRINNKLDTKYNTLWLGNLDVSEGLLADNGVSSESHLKATLEYTIVYISIDRGITYSATNKFDKAMNATEVLRTMPELVYGCFKSQLFETLQCKICGRNPLNGVVKGLCGMGNIWWINRVDHDPHPESTCLCTV